MISWFCSHLRAHARRLVPALLALVGLVVFCLQVKEQYPFSNFPMYANPRAEDVDYYFLTDAAGNPLSTRDYAGMSAPQIKKRMATMLNEKRPQLGLKKGAEVPLSVLQGVAQALLQRMRGDSATTNPPAVAWPAGVQLQQALIHTLPEGFNETFRTLATLPDAGPASPTQAVTQVTEDDMQALGKNLGRFFSAYAWLIGALMVLLVSWKTFPPKWQACFAGGLEAWCLRLGLAIVFYQALDGTGVQYDKLPHPQGIANWECGRALVLWCGELAHWQQLMLWVVPLLAWYVLGWGPVLPLTLLTLLHICQRTLYNSQGAPHHGFQIVTLVFLAQTVVAWSFLLLRLWPQKFTALRPHAASLAWLAMAVAISATYVITACEKWRTSDGRWLRNTPYLSNNIVKTYHQNFYDDLNPSYLQGSPPVPLTTPDPEHDRYRLPIPNKAQWMLTHPVASRIFFGIGLFMEFGAWLLILHRGLAAAYGMALISFHLMVAWLMALSFPQNIETLFVVCLNLPGWLLWWRTRKTPSPTPA